MIEFVAGFAVGGLLLFVAGLVVGELMRARCQSVAVTPQTATLPERQGERELPAYPYHPPVIVLAGDPRARVEQHNTALARR